MQFVELLWILFTYLGIEHSRITPDAVHLDYLPVMSRSSLEIDWAATVVPDGPVPDV